MNSRWVKGVARRSGLVICASIGLAQVVAAQLGSRPAAEWIKALEDPARVAGLKIDQIISSLGLQPGQVVADLGAGSGVISFPMAKAVAPGGKVYAVEIDQAFLDHIVRKAQDQNLPNVVPVRGQPDDPALPAADVDLALLHDVLHHIADRPGYLKQVARYLKPGGRVAIIDLIPAKSPHRDDPALQVTKDNVRAWMADAGFVLTQDFALFEDKWFVVYARGR